MLGMVQAQEAVYPIDKITHLQLSRSSMYPLVYENGLFTARYFLGETPEKIQESSHHETREYIEKNGNIIIPIEKIDHYTQEQFLSKLSNIEWLIYQGEKYLETIQMVWGGRFQLYRLYRFEESSKDKKSWNIIHEFLSPIYFISLPNNALYLQGVGNNSHYIVPYENGFLAGSSDQNTKAKAIIGALDYAKYGMNEERHLYQTLRSINWKYTYEIHQLAEKNQYVLRYTRNNQLLLDGTFDEIIKNQYYVVTRKGDNYDIYNTLLQPIIKNVRDYNFDNLNIQVLKDNEVTTKGVSGGAELVFDEYYLRDECGAGKAERGE